MTYELILSDEAKEQHESVTKVRAKENTKEDS